MARPKNQERRRAELVAVTSRLLVERGAAGARLTDIAEAAHVTPATISYYYPDLAELYVESHSTVTSEYVTRRTQKVRARAGAREQLVECIRLGIPVKGQPSYDATVLLLELTALGSRTPAITAAANVFEAAELQLYDEVLRLGVTEGNFDLRFSTAEVARLLLAVEDGVAYPVVDGRMRSSDALDLSIRNAALLTRDPELAAVRGTRARA